MNQRIVSQTEWLEARKALLVKEKELTRASDAVARERQELPWVKIDKAYVFEGPRGTETLADLFGPNSQLIVKHFMFGPGWNEGCVGCSFGSDHIGGALLHLEHHDVSFLAVSRAPLAEIEPFRRRMGWTFKWVSSFGSDFNYDFNVSFKPGEKTFYNYKEGEFGGEEGSGFSVFYKDERGDVFHTYSCYARGDEKVVGTYMLLDLTPKGRNETGNLTSWVRHHDRYSAGGFVDSTGRYSAEQKKDNGLVELAGVRSTS